MLSSFSFSAACAATPRERPALIAAIVNSLGMFIMCMFDWHPRRIVRNESHHAGHYPTKPKCADVWPGPSILAETWLHFIRRPDWPDRDHADRAGRKEKMDQPIAFSSRPQF